jgi:sterol desaturase/sphingolipid hydroxylase (fatty acid hydroxylase superfamily)
LGSSDVLGREIFSDIRCYNRHAKSANAAPGQVVCSNLLLCLKWIKLSSALIIIYLAPEVHRGNSIVLNVGWFLMRIMLADLCFYIAHWLLHRKLLQKIHLKYHDFRDTSSFVAGHKSLIEYVIVTITDILPIFIFGYDITQLCAWTLIGNAYNLEGHSSLSIFFIPSDFHDLHHFSFSGNYGIHGFWDRIFNTINNPNKKVGLVFLVGSIESKLTKSAANIN